MSQSILNFFGCCGENPQQRERKNTNSNLQTPISIMSYQTPPNRSFKALQQGYSSQRTNRFDMKDEYHMNRTSLNHLHGYPYNEVFVLGNKKKIVAIRTRKKISKETSAQVSFRESLSSLAKENTKNNSHSNTSHKMKWSNLVKNCASIENKKDLSSKNENLASSNASNVAHYDNLGGYLASRLKCDIMIDAMCGSGEITKYVIQFLYFEAKSAVFSLQVHVIT